MAHRLDSLHTGTPVFVGTSRVGEIRGVYADGTSRAVELIAVSWTSRSALVAVAPTDVFAIDDNGVTLIGDDVASYDSLPPFEPAGLTTLHEIAPTE